MSDTIDVDSIKDKMIPAVNLVPVLEKIYVFAQIPDKLEDRKLFADVYKTLLAQIVGDDKPVVLDGVKLGYKAGEDLPKHSACYVDPSDGLAYRVKREG
jgi:hypothetical protein